MNNRNLSNEEIGEFIAKKNMTLIFRQQQQFYIQSRDLNNDIKIKDIYFILYSINHRLDYM